MKPTPALPRPPRGRGPSAPAPPHTTLATSSLRRAILPALAVLIGLASVARLNAAPVVLYDPTAGNRLDQQGFMYLNGPPLQPVDTALGYSGGLTTLDTTADIGEASGFFTHDPLSGVQVHPSAPTLDRSAGFLLRFDLQLFDEVHNARDDNNDGLFDRAGFSVIAVAQDLLAIELGFLDNGDGTWRVFAYEDDSPNAGDIFTQAESHQLSDAEVGALTKYELSVLGSGYSLAADGTTILSGSLRDYTAYNPFPDPYDKPNMIFLGDDTSSASSSSALGLITVGAVPEPGTWLLAASAAVMLTGVRRPGRCRRATALPRRRA